MKLIIISGWAFPGNALNRLSSALGSFYDTRTVSINELSSGAGGLINLIDNLDEPCMLMGWSTGGMFALEAALHMPEKIKGLFLISSTPRFCSAPDYKHGVAPLSLRMMMRDIRNNTEIALTDFLASLHEPFNEDAGIIREEVQSALSIGSAGLSAGLKYLMEADLRDSLSSINIPSVVFHGKEDAVIPWQAGRFLSDGIRDCSLKLIEGAGHDLPIRSPELIVEEVDNVLNTAS